MASRVVVVMIPAMTRRPPLTATSTKRASSSGVSDDPSPVLPPTATKSTPEARMNSISRPNSSTSRSSFESKVDTTGGITPCSSSFERGAAMSVPFWRRDRGSPEPASAGRCPRFLLQSRGLSHAACRTTPRRVWGDWLHAQRTPRPTSSLCLHALYTYRHRVACARDASGDQLPRSPSRRLVTNDALHLPASIGTDYLRVEC